MNRVYLVGQFKDAWDLSMNHEVNNICQYNNHNTTNPIIEPPLVTKIWLYNNYPQFILELIYE